MSQTPACPEVPDDVKQKAWLVYLDCITTGTPDGADFIAAAIMEDRASRALPSTALAARPEEGWQIKPLDWVKSHVSSWDGDYHTVPTSYTIRCADENGWKWSGAGGFGYAPSPAAAKAAAQADYETRIRSAFVAPSTPPTAGDGTTDKKPGSE